MPMTGHCRLGYVWPWNTNCAAAPEPLDRTKPMIISMREQLARLAAEVAAMPVADDRTPEEIIGYDDLGLPH